MALLNKHSDKYSEFCETPRFFTINQRELDVSADCKPRRLEDLKPLVEARIQELLRLSTCMRTRFIFNNFCGIELGVPGPPGLPLGYAHDWPP